MLCWIYIFLTSSFHLKIITISERLDGKCLFSFLTSKHLHYIFMARVIQSKKDKRISRNAKENPFSSYTCMFKRWHV